MKISVVVPTKDRAPEVRALLAALERQTLRPDEVLIVDAGAPGDLEPLGSRGPLRVRRLSAAANVCLQRNVGARAASGDLVFFFDDDVVPEPDFIAAMCSAFERSPEFAAGMGSLPPTTTRWSFGNLLCRVFMLQHEFGDGGWYPSGLPRHPYGTGEFREIAVLGGGLMAVRSSVFSRDGIYFDEDMPHSLEDAEFAWRLSRKRKLFFNPRARVAHTASATGRASPREAARRYAAAYRRHFARNVRPSRPWLAPAHAWTVLGSLLVGLLAGGPTVFAGLCDGLLGRPAEPAPRERIS